MAKSLIISFQYNIESVYFFYSNPVYLLEITLIYVIPGFRREVGENCPLQGHYAASSGNLLPTFRDFGFLTLEDATDILSRYVSKNYHYSLCDTTAERGSNVSTVSNSFLSRPPNHNHLQYTHITVKENQSHYRPGVTQRILGNYGSQIS